MFSLHITEYRNKRLNRPAQALSPRHWMFLRIAWLLGQTQQRGSTVWTTLYHTNQLVSVLERAVLLLCFTPCREKIPKSNDARTDCPELLLTSYRRQHCIVPVMQNNPSCQPVRIRPISSAATFNSPIFSITLNLKLANWKRLRF